MKLENEFVVSAPIERAWTVMLDVERITPCLPGATLDEASGDEYRGQMKVKLGPIMSTYKGTLKIDQADEAEHRAVLVAKARDARGQGTASATITSTMEPEGDGTRVRVVTDMRVTGPAAQFGRGVMQDVSAKLMREFAGCLEQEIAREPAAAAAAGDGAPAPEPAAPAEPQPATAAGAGAPGGVGTEHPTPAPAPKSAGTATAASAAAATGETPPAHEPPPPRRPTADVLDLGEASRGAVLKRAAPVAAGLVALLVVLRIIRRR